MAAPLDPTPPQARDQLAHELDHPEYWVHRNLLNDFLHWLLRTLSGHADGNGVTSHLVTFLVYAVLVVLVAFLLRWVVRASRDTPATERRRESSALVQAGVSAEQYLEQARDALAAHDPDSAVAAGFRSLVVSLERAGILGDSPARTAHEVAMAAASALHGESEAIERAARCFDLAVYGVAAAPRTSPDQAQQTIALAERLARMGIR